MLRAFKYTGPDGYLEPIRFEDPSNADWQEGVYVIPESDKELLRSNGKHFRFVENRRPVSAAALWDYFYSVSQASRLTADEYLVVTKRFKGEPSLRKALNAFWERLKQPSAEVCARVPRLRKLVDEGKVGTHILCVEVEFFDDDLDGKRKFQMLSRGVPLDPAREVPNWARAIMDGRLWGNSSAMHDVREFIWRAARLKSAKGLRSHVLVQGPAGTGKEVVAELIHQVAFEQKDQPPPPNSYYALDCKALSGGTLACALFGWVDQQGGEHPGALETCSTVVLDRVVEMDYPVQLELEQALLRSDPMQGVSAQFSLIMGTDRPGSPRKSRARIIALTGADLYAKTSQFRAQLHFLLSRCVISTPSLADHPQDIVELANRFWKNSDQNHQLLSPDVLAQLSNVSFRGNGREVESLMRHASQSFPDVPLLTFEQLREMLEDFGYRPAGGTSSPARYRRLLRQLKDVVQRALMELDCLEHAPDDPRSAESCFESKLRELEALTHAEPFQAKVAPLVRGAQAALDPVLGALSSGTPLPSDAINRARDELRQNDAAIDAELRLDA